jgi:hypothetical protein
MWCGQNGLNCKICQFFMCVLSDEKNPMMKLRNKVHLSAFNIEWHGGRRTRCYFLTPFVYMLRISGILFGRGRTM